MSIALLPFAVACYYTLSIHSGASICAVLFVAVNQFMLSLLWWHLWFVPALW